MDMIETHPLVILLVALLTPLLTYAISKAGVVGERLRPILPIIATGLAIGLVSAGLHWMEGGGGDGSTMEKVWNGLFAGALAVLAWSQGREGKKAVDSQSKGPGAAAKTGVVLVGVMLLVGCGGSGPVTVGELLPNVHATRDDQGCLALEVEQPVPVEGWEVTNTVKVRQEPGSSGNCRDKTATPTP